MAEHNNYDLRPVWKEMLAIYSVFRGICDRHGLRHWVVYGTLIGAVRHKGFIPWDDDFDVAMPRPDYERFQDIVRNELPNNYEWHSPRFDSSYGLAFGKLVNHDKGVLDRVVRESKLKMTQGLFIDVFPFDGIPSSRVGSLFWYAGRAFLRRHASLKTLIRFLSSFKFEKSTYITNSNSAWGYGSRMKMVKRREWVSSLSEVKFEDSTVMIPADYDPYLRCEFGDYMQMPPVEQRVPSHQCID